MRVHHGDGHQIARRESSGLRRMGVQINPHRIRLFLHQHLFCLSQHAPRHGPMTATPSPQIVSRCRNSQFSEKDTGHPLIVVLTGLHHDFTKSFLLQSRAHRTRLDELRSCPHHRNHGFLILLPVHAFGQRWQMFQFPGRGHS